MKNYCVYCHINKINGKRYVGLTGQDPNKRFGANGINYKGCPNFYKAIKKYGWDNFEHIILQTNLTADEAVEWEQKYIELYDCMVPNGYNLTAGGELKKTISEETRQRLRASHLGYKWTEEQRKHSSESRKGHIGYNRKAVWMCDKKTHQRIKLFPSTMDAGAFLNKHPAHIGHVCRKERPSAYGYYWEYDQDGGELPSHS